MHDTLKYILEPIVKDMTSADKAAEGVYEWLKSVDSSDKRLLSYYQGFAAVMKSNEI